MRLDYPARHAQSSRKSNARNNFPVSSHIFSSKPRTVLQRASALVCFLVIATFAAADKPLESGTDLTALDPEKLLEISFVPDIVAATKFKQKTTEAPASVSVVSSEDIKRYGYRTLADVLQSVQGLYVTGDRNYSFLGVRGINLGDFNSRVLVLVDGHRINNSLTDGANIGTAFLVDVDLIDHVEIVRGAGSVLYGNNAFFGVINVVTRQGAQINGAEASGEYGEFNTWKGRFTLGNKWKNEVELLLSGSLYESDGDRHLFYRQFNTPAQNNGVARNLDDDSFRSFLGKVSYRDFSLEGAFITREKGNPTAQFATTFNNPHLRTKDEQSYVNLKYAHTFSEGSDLSAQIYYDRSTFDIGYPFSPSLFKENQIGESWGAEVQFNKHLFDRHMITVGAEFKDDFHQHDRVYDDGTGQTFTDVSRDRINYGIYFQADFEVVTNVLHLNGGIRFDQYGNFDPSFNPRVAVIYDPFPKSTFKAIYGTAFRAPNFLELSDTRFQNIGPEKIKSYELVYEQGIGSHLRSSLSGFYNQIDGLIVLQDGRFQNFNLDTRGVEVALESFWANGLRATASYTYQQPENQSTDLMLPDSPNHLGKFNISVPVFRTNIFAGLEFLYVSTRETVSTTTTGDTVQGRNVSGYGLVNFTLFSQNLIKNLDVSGSVYNLLDHKYGDPATRFHQQDIIMQDGRTFRVKLTYRF